MVYPMNDNKEKKLTEENKWVESIKNTFQTANAFVQRERRVIVELRKDLIPPFLSYAKEYLSCKHFSHMSCVDWLEEGEFELVYLLWSPEKRIQLTAKCRIPRDDPKFVTVQEFWRQANTYEREIHEMYGIFFEGNADMDRDFILEDWDEIPPMRRDFDTKEYVKKAFFERGDREKDHKDVRDVISERSGEDIPEYAKKYSR